MCGYVTEITNFLCVEGNVIELIPVMVFDGKKL